jgi:hypothetical protein
VERRHSVEFRNAAAALRRKALHPEAEPMVRLVVVRPMAVRSARREGVRPAGRAAEQRPGPPSAAVAPRVRVLRLAEWPVPALPLAGMVAQQSAEPAVPVAAAVRRQAEMAQVSGAQPQVAPPAGAAEGLLSEAQAVVAAQPWVEQVEAVALPWAVPAAEVEELPSAAQAAGVEELPWAAPAAGAEGLPSAAQAEAAVLPGARAGRGAAEAPQRAARGAAPGVLLLAAAWAALPSIRCQEGRLAPSAPAQSAHAREGLRTAQP